MFKKVRKKNIQLSVKLTLVVAWILIDRGRDTARSRQRNDQDIHKVAHLIQKGKTTNFDILKAFGHPAQTTSIDVGQEVRGGYFRYSE